jgi:low temperature requirement protein LtrA
MELEINVEESEQNFGQDQQAVQDVNWNEKTEILLNGWADECKKCAVSHRWKQKLCKYSYTSIFLPIMILSYIFGSAGLAMKTNENSAISTAQNYILLVVGILTTILKIAKLEKRAKIHKQKYGAFIKFNNSIIFQLALPVSSRKSCIAFVASKNREYGKLIKI